MVVSLSRFMMFGLNNTRVVKDERHTRLVELVRDRRVLAENGGGGGGGEGGGGPYSRFACLL